MINYEVIIIIVLIIIILYLFINKQDFKGKESFGMCYCPTQPRETQFICDGQLFKNECMARCSAKNIEDCRPYSNTKSNPKLTPNLEDL